MNNLKDNLDNVNARIASACKTAHRTPDSVNLLAVSKKHAASRVRLLFDAGQRAFGENYVQEALAKQTELHDLAIEWHFIGPVQSNKTGDLAHHFDWVQSVDREKILRRLSSQRPTDSPDLNICLQVNIDNEPQKGGACPTEIPSLADLTATLPGLRLRGLMVIPRAPSPGHDTKPSLIRMAELFEELRRQYPPMDTLSMGMSADLEQAIRAGSTMVRVGTDLFGPRD